MAMRKARAELARIRAELPGFGWKILYDWSFSLGALIAYNLIISLLPLILCLFAISSLLFGDDVDVLNKIRERLLKTFPGQGISEVVDTLLKSLTNQAGLVFTITFIVSIFTGSRLFVCIDDVLTIVYRIRERTLLDQNIQAIKMLLIFILIMPFIVVSSAIPAVLMEQEGLYSFITTIISGLLTFTLFYLIYYYAPKRKMAWGKTWCGALFAAVGLLILLLLFPIYVHQFMTNYVGQIGFIVIALLLFYICGLLLVIGAQINAYFFDHIKALPAGVGTCLSEFADREHEHLIDENSQPNNSTSTLIEGFNLQH